METLIRTKLLVPQAPGILVPRPRLVEQLSAGLALPLTLISAPAGFGKTTLAAEWVRQAPCPAAWISLDEADNNPVRFGTYLLASFAASGIIGDADLTASTQGTESLETGLIAIINQVVELPGDLALVLDNYQTIHAGAVHTALLFLLNHLPAQLHLVLLSRTDPPLPLARYRTHGQLLELRARDLKFDGERIRDFLGSKLGQRFDENEILAIESRTEGWAAALQMGAFYLQQESGFSNLLDAFSGHNRFIGDYLEEEVLDPLPGVIREFLFQTAILNSLNAALCQAVVRLDDARDAVLAEDAGLLPQLAVRSQTGEMAQILEFLDRQNLFIEPMDSARVWYRYHNLFVDYLRACIQQSRPEQVAELHHRAGRWYEEQGYLEEAIVHALAGQDDERAARLIEGQAVKMFAFGRVRSLLGWLDNLPETAIRPLPRLCLYKAWALLLMGNLEEAAACLNEAEKAVRNDGKTDPQEASRSAKGLLAALQCRLALQGGDYAAAVARGQGALEDPQLEDPVSRSSLLLSLGLAHTGLGDVQAAEAAWKKSRSLSKEAGQLSITFQTLRELAGVAFVKGNLPQAESCFREGIALSVGVDGRPLLSAAIIYVALGNLLREKDNLSQSFGYLREGLSLARRGGNVRTILLGCFGLAQTLEALGELNAAREVLDQAALLPPAVGLPWERAQIQAFRALLSARMKRGRAANRWLESAVGYLAAPQPQREFELLVLVRLFLLQDRPGDALALLPAFIQAAEKEGRLGSLIQLKTLHASALLAAGKERQAREALAEALAVPGAGGYRRSFTADHARLGAILEELAGEEFLPTSPMRPRTGRERADFERPVLIPKSWTGGLPLEPASGPRGWSVHPVEDAAAPEVEALSRRELQILRLVAAGLSNKEIAAELVVATSTVQWHAKNIYRKLGVNNRVQAGLRAQELGLLTYR